jgi:hypothetical protein
MNEVAHHGYLLQPTAREDNLGKWLPVVWVRAERGRHLRVWKPRAIRSERYQTRDVAEYRSMLIAKQMIDEGDFN